MMKRVLVFILLTLCLFSIPSIAETNDYTFLDGMSLSELEALQLEVASRISKAKEDSTNANDTDMWLLQYFVDEFNLPTDEGYIVNAHSIIGTFSNSATTNSKLAVNILVDFRNNVQFFLYEYGKHPVKNPYSSKNKYYTVTMMDSAGKRHSFDGFFNTNGDRLFFNKENNATIIKALSEKGTVRFSIKESNGSSSYLFEIKDTSNFTNAYNTLMKKN